MTEHRNLKRAVRARMRMTGENYTTALSHVGPATPVGNPSSTGDLSMRESTTHPAVKLFTDCTNRDWRAVRDSFDERTKARLPESRLSAVWQDVTGAAGALQEQGEPHEKRSGDVTVVDVPLTFERSTLVGRVAYDVTGQVAGLSVLTPEAAAAYSQVHVSTMTADITSGHIVIDPDTAMVFEGVIQGTMEVPEGCHLTVNGALRGTLRVSAGATAELGATGTVEGDLRIDGVLRNGGTRTEAWSGRGEVIDLPGSTVR